MVTDACKMALCSSAQTLAVIQMRVRLVQARDRRLPRPTPRPTSPPPAPQTMTVMQRWLDMNA